MAIYKEINRKKVYYVKHPLLVAEWPRSHLSNTMTYKKNKFTGVIIGTQTKWLFIITKLKTKSQQVINAKITKLSTNIKLYIDTYWSSLL